MLLLGYVTGNGCIVMERRIWYNKVDSLCIRDICYVLETIAAEDMQILRSEMDGQPERVMDAVFNYDVKDETAGFTFSDRHVKIRKLNHKIGENLKLLYGYRCQI